MPDHNSDVESAERKNKILGAVFFLHSLHGETYFVLHVGCVNFSYVFIALHSRHVPSRTLAPHIGRPLLLFVQTF